MLPGADLQQTVLRAAELRAGVVVDADDGNQRVTMSCGVSASARGEPFCYRKVFAAADEALYEAKRTGRDRVCVSGLGAAGGGVAALGPPPLATLGTH